MRLPLLAAPSSFMSSSPVALGSVLRLPRGPRASALTLPRLLALGLPADISSSVSVHSSPPSPRVFSPSCLFHVPVRAPPSESTFEPLLCPGAQRCRLPVPSPRVLPTPPPAPGLLLTPSHLPLHFSPLSPQLSPISRFSSPSQPFLCNALLLCSRNIKGLRH